MNAAKSRRVAAATLVLAWRPAQGEDMFPVPGTAGMWWSMSLRRIPR
jgi:hypothetical protein